MILCLENLWGVKVCQALAHLSVPVPDDSGPATRACDGCSQDPDKGDCGESTEKNTTQCTLDTN